MIEVTRGTLEEQIIKILQKTYPVTVEDIRKQLHLSKNIITRVLNKLQIRDIVQLDPLPDKTYIRLLRNDFSFIGRKHQRKFIKHHSTGKKIQNPEYDGIMYT